MRLIFVLLNLVNSWKTFHGPEFLRLWHAVGLSSYQGEGIMKIEGNAQALRFFAFSV